MNCLLQMKILMNLPMKQLSNHLVLCHFPISTRCCLMEIQLVFCCLMTLLKWIQQIKRWLPRCNTARIEQVTNEATIILPDLGPLLPPPEDSQIANESQEDRDDSDSANKPAALVKDSRVESVSEGDSMENNTAEFAWTRQHDTLLSRLMLEKLAKRDKRRTRCRQCGHFVKDPSLKHFHRDPGYKVGQARPRSCTVAPSQRREGFPVPPGKRMPPIPRVQLSEILQYL